MNVQSKYADRADIRQDLRAMQRATNWDAVDSIRRAMVGLGRWSLAAQSVYESKCIQFGHKPTEGEQA
jgi:hypothetical protein